MNYTGHYPLFDTSRIRTYPLGDRASKVHTDAIMRPEAVAGRRAEWTSPQLEETVEAVRTARAKGQPVIWMTGAHLIKNGFGPLLADLIQRGVVTLAATNMAGMIHDLELALVGRTSEDVPRALPRGEFGFAEETASLLNGAMAHAERLGVGLGEAVGRLIEGEAFPEAVEFAHRELSVAAAAWRTETPLTVHAGIGADIIDQHASWDPSAKGGCSGRDFLIFAAEIERMAETGGGVYLNIGSAITGPEVLLKACSMAANVGHAPKGLFTASFDIRPAALDDADDERKAAYYFRDVKTVVVRVPESFEGRGVYVQGNHLATVPALYQMLCA